jgi:hypothetical protein
MEDTCKWEVFVKEHKIKIEELPENVQHKIDVFEETYSEYESTDDEEETLIRDLEAKLMAMDNGILSELQSFVAKKKESTPAEGTNPKAEGATPKAEDGGQTPPTPTPPQHQTSDKPSWAFWM